MTFAWMEFSSLMIRSAWYFMEYNVRTTEPFSCFLIGSSPILLIVNAGPYVERMVSMNS